MNVNFTPIDIVGNAMTQFRESTRNLEALSEARRKISQENEDRAFTKKEQEFKLEKAKREGAISELEFNISNSMFKEWQKQQNQVQAGKTSLIDLEEKKQLDGKRQAQTLARNLFQQDPKGTIAAMATVKQAENQRMLRAKFANGKFGFEEVDVEAERLAAEDKASIREERELDILTKKKKLAGGISTKDALDIQARKLDILSKQKQLKKDSSVKDFLDVQSKKLDIQKKQKDLRTVKTEDDDWTAAELKLADKFYDNDEKYEDPVETKMKRALKKARETLSRDTTAPTEENVRVRLPNGRGEGSIPKSQLKTALKNGAVQL